MRVLFFTSALGIPCRQLKPTMLRLQAATGFDMESIEDSPETRVDFEKYGVRSVPTVIALDDENAKVGMFVGAQAEAICANHLRKWGVIQ